MWILRFSIVFTIIWFSINPVYGYCPSELRTPTSNKIPVFPVGEYIPISAISTAKSLNDAEDPPIFTTTSHPVIPYSYNLTDYFIFNISKSGIIEKTFRIENRCPLVEHLVLNPENSLTYKMYNKITQEYCIPDYAYEIPIHTRFSNSGDFGIIYGCMPDKIIPRVSDWPEVGIFVIARNDLFSRNTSAFSNWKEIAMELLSFDEKFDGSRLYRMKTYNSQEENNAGSTEYYWQYQQSFCKRLLCKNYDHKYPFWIFGIIPISFIIVIIVFIWYKKICNLYFGQ